MVLVLVLRYPFGDCNVHDENFHLRSAAEFQSYESLFRVGVFDENVLADGTEPVKCK
jgi:hypothetical protein